MQPAPQPANPGPIPPGFTASADLRILPDGTVHVRNLTPALARILADLHPGDPLLRFRAEACCALPPASASTPASMSIPTPLP